MSRISFDAVLAEFRQECEEVWRMLGECWWAGED